MTKLPTKKRTCECHCHTKPWNKKEHNTMAWCAYHCKEMKISTKKRIKKTVKAWIIGNVISFTKPKYKSPFFKAEKVLITYTLIK